MHLSCWLILDTAQHYKSSCSIRKVGGPSHPVSRQHCLLSMDSKQHRQLSPVSSSSGRHTAHATSSAHSLLAADQQWQSPAWSHGSSSSKTAAAPNNSSSQRQPQGVQQLQHHLQGELQNAQRRTPQRHAVHQQPQHPQALQMMHHPVNPCLTQTELAKAKQQLEGKRFQIDTSSCKLPRPEQLFSSGSWQTPQLMFAKVELNTTKDKLDHVDLK